MLIGLIVLGVLVALLLGILYVCYRMAFYSAPRVHDGSIPLPEGEIYEPYLKKIEGWVLEARAMPSEAMEVRSFDGLTLRGNYYEYAPGAPIELMFPGYRGCAERDLCGGVQRCFRLGHSALVVDQRSGGYSDGNVITFGVREHRDVAAWLEMMQQRFGSDVQIILTGISMGGATVLDAAGTELPENVIGVLADCPFSSPKAIILEVLGQMGLPPKLCYPFVKLGARVWGGFDLESVSPVEAVTRAKVPVLLFHGEADAYVPCHMSRQIYDACASKKKLVTVPGAGHGLCYPVDPKGYLSAVEGSFGRSSAISPKNQDRTDPIVRSM